MSNIRFGIFLRPDPATCLAVTQITHAVRQQFGLVAAAAFPPHATLIGNLRTDGSDDQLIDVLDPVFADVHPIAVYNHGIDRRADSIRYDVNRDASGATVNGQLASIASAVRDVVLPLHVRHDDLLAPNVQDYRFAAHLSLASFELSIDDRLTREVGEFIEGLPISPPASFVAGHYSLFRFQADWSGHWWTDMPWEHIRSWDVRSHPASTLDDRNDLS